MDLLRMLVTHWAVAVPLIVASATLVAMLLGVFDDGRIDL